MKRYPKYKESGVEFIGEIPAHWEARKLGQVSTIFKGGTPKRNVDKYFQGDLPWAKPVDVTALQGALYIDDTEIHISEEALGNSGARCLPRGNGFTYQSCDNWRNCNYNRTDGNESRFCQFCV